MNGKKDRKNVEFHEIPPEVLWNVGKVFSHGAEKYGPFNWSKGYDWSRSFNSTMRHLIAFWGGENLDRESQHSHILHAIANLMILYCFQIRGIGLDDRQITDVATYSAAHIEKESHDQTPLQPAR